MDAATLIGTIISRHAEGRGDHIELCYGVRLEPQLRYTGKMARQVYYGRRRSLNKGRPYVGILDFKIIIDGKDMEHEDIMAVHEGKDPFSLSADPEAIKAGCVIQAAMAEHEANWGEEDFQLRTYFGRGDTKDELLRSSAPRDYFMAYMERAAKVMEETEGDPHEAVKDVIGPFITNSQEARSKHIGLPLDGRKAVLPDFRPCMPRSIRGVPTVKWVDAHLPEIRQLCRSCGVNPHGPSNTGLAK